eukprot:122061_1
MEIQPFLSADKLQEIADALNGAKGSVNTSCVTVPSDWKLKHTQPPEWDDIYIIDETASIYVDFNKGDDNNDGSVTSPLKHLDFAVETARKHYGSEVYKRIILREGRHYLRKIIEITPEDNNLLISNFNRELVELSAATPLNCKWSQTVINASIYACHVTADIDDILGLRVNGTRAIRARYPNGNPEIFPCGFCSSLKAKSWVAPTCKAEPTTEYYPDQPLRTTSQSFQKYQMGVGGCCDGFTPNGGYWCGNHTSGGGAFTYRIPSGLTYDKSVLPNSPYANPTGGVIQAWRPAHWSSWMFLLDPKTYDPAKSTIQFIKGGFQGARGSKSGGEFYIENIFEELDYPTEWFYNESAKTLYYVQNGTGTPANTVFEATNLKVLVNYTGSMAKPVENQAVRGVTLRDSQYTYLDDHGMPSGGDWGLERTGAIYLDGVRNIEIINNTMTRLDGNAISVNRYARGVVIEGNEIVWQGDSAITQWGDTQNITFTDGTSMGDDGTNGNQP